MHQTLALCAAMLHRDFTAYTSGKLEKLGLHFGLLYFLLYGLGRAWIEGLRTDSLYIGSTDIRVSQALSLALVLVSLVILIIQSRRPHPPEKLFVNQVRSREEAARAEAEADKEEKENQL